MVSSCWRQDLNMPVGPSVSFGSGERASRCDASARRLQKDSSIRSDQPSSTRSHRRPHRARAACLSRDGRGSPVQQKRHRGVRREVPSSTSHNKWIFHGQLVEMVNGENGRTDPSSRQEPFTPECPSLSILAGTRKDGTVQLVDFLILFGRLHQGFQR